MIDIGESGYAFVDVDLENSDGFVRIVWKPGRVVASKKHQRVSSHVLGIDGPSDLKSTGLRIQNEELASVPALDVVMNLRKGEHVDKIIALIGDCWYAVVVKTNYRKCIYLLEGQRS